MHSSLSSPSARRSERRRPQSSAHRRTMQGTSHYSAACAGDKDMAEWIRSGRGAKQSSATVSTLCTYSQDDENVGLPILDIPLADLVISSSDWASSTTRGDPFGSQCFLLDVPEISSTTASSTTSTTDFEDNDDGSWPGPMQRTPSNSSPEPSDAVATEILTHTRHRSTSISSTVSRPAPARSILSTGSSMRTKRARAPPSVKFLDMPTIHFEDEDEDASPNVPSPSSTALTKSRVFGFFGWLATVGKGKKMESLVPERPPISGPFPLWEKPLRRNDNACRSAGAADTRSIRSVRSQSSIRSAMSFRSIRSCASRVQGYWSRLNGRDP
ncbi:uncharacterized protein PHACADRAFT_246859 [Phanerochaete carnosa HHB-10118-sp]|uniref:Uncharacterized protein n=1 Tax=Phanerochaete carnosa (strain HHB-10118-sp) TaxID=650164 RepID=K5WMR6_PHACS|nr:uncharacterized protein PHACADRAFT_246859 [Phanerochaete carnosa HHB-10118-sp]EKM60745.1 hypothetical protein PHACADRAFT_246859 [Phanerochaete carnosa HHB-10118-sp]